MRRNQLVGFFLSTSILFTTCFLLLSQSEADPPKHIKMAIAVESEAGANAVISHTVGQGFTWMDVPGMKLEITTNGYPVMVFVNIHNIRRVVAQPRAVKFALAIDGKRVEAEPAASLATSQSDPAYFFARENAPVYLSDQMHFCCPLTDVAPGPHQISLQWAGDGVGPANIFMNLSPQQKPSIVAMELIDPIDFVKLRTDLFNYVKKFETSLQETRVEQQKQSQNLQQEIQNLRRQLEELRALVSAAETDSTKQ